MLHFRLFDFLFMVRSETTVHKTFEYSLWRCEQLPASEFTF